MKEPGDFLSRWSRRKREAAEGVANTGGQDPAPPREGGEPEPESAGSQIGANVQPAAKAAKEDEKTEAKEPVFDLSKLPALDSITAETDIRPFLAAGVPASLRQAALRRAWVADPAIRDFIGIAENQWDFTPGGNAPGFDFSAPAGDVKRMVAEIFGGKREPAATGSSEVAESNLEALSSVRQSSQEIEDVSPSAQDQIAVSDGTAEPVSDDHRAQPDPAGADTQTLLEKQEDIAAQNNDAPRQEKFPIASRRSHGGALPK